MGFRVPGSLGLGLFRVQDLEFSVLSPRLNWSFGCGLVSGLGRRALAVYVQSRWQCAV